jgi:hypothetical protein
MFVGATPLLRQTRLRGRKSGPVATRIIKYLWVLIMRIAPSTSAFERVGERRLSTL